MEELLSNAEQLDNQKKLDEISRRSKLEKIHKWQRDTKKLYAWLIRTEENPPSDYDIQKLEMCMHFFRKTAGIFIFIILSSCSKEGSHEITGSWMNSEAVYTFDSELHINEDGITENYCYFISNDTIYLDYGFPFVIEKLTEYEMTLSKNDGTLKYWYEFDRIE